MLSLAAESGREYTSKDLLYIIAADLLSIDFRQKAMVSAAKSAGLLGWDDYLSRKFPVISAVLKHFTPQGMLINESSRCLDG
jgi:hypothetical protein